MIELRSQQSIQGEIEARGKAATNQPTWLVFIYLFVFLPLIVGQKRILWYLLGNIFHILKVVKMLQLSNEFNLKSQRSGVMSLRL